MHIISLNELYLGEHAEIVAIQNDTPESKRIRAMGVREGQVVELIYQDDLITKKTLVLVDNLKIGLESSITQAIKVRPIRSCYETMRNHAFYDCLTGCMNRYMSQEFFRNEYEKFQDNMIPLALLLLDLDHFKRINDSYGHPVGDEVLKAFAGLLKQNMRRSDMLFRWGGEEFLIMLRGTLSQEAVAVAERIRKKTQAFPFPPFGKPGLVTTSIGVCGLPPLRSIQDLVETADAMLYKAKNKGRNQVHSCRSRDG
jgi:diguanylate cyclase (GGDEF)-like protein